MVPTQPSPPAAPASKRPGAKRTRPASDAKERREALVSHLRTQGSTSVADLPRLFGVSIETIRRDLRLLESTGRIRRSYGRVAAADSGSFESSREFRVSHLVDEKERIARAAVEHLDTAETIFLDEGFHPLLVGRALPTAIELAERPRTQVVVIGGRIRPITLAAVERWATRMLREMEPDLAVIGANGVNEEGWLTTPHASVAEVKETVLATAHRAVFVGSHTKFGHSTFARFGHVRQLERVITGRELRSSTARRLTGLGAVIERV